MTDQVNRIASLRNQIEQIQDRRPEDWSESLSERKKEEIQFHDQDRSVLLDTEALRQAGGKDTSNRKYYSAARKSQQYVKSWIEREAPGRVFLDYACGNGGNAIHAAKAGAALAVGLDISPVAIEVAQKRAEAAGVKSNTLFYQGDCENTELPGSSIDRIICAGMLHHLKLADAVRELERIVRPDGKILAKEALAYNPLFKLYRKMTPHLRTTWEMEHIITVKDVKQVSRILNIENERYWHLFSLLSVPFRNTLVFDAMLSCGEWIDRYALKVPGLKLLAWMVTFEMVMADM